MRYLSFAQKAFWLFAGGGIGTLLRYFVSSSSNRYFNSGFPVGTTIINLSGSLLIGFLWSSMELVNMSPNLRAFVFIGFLGGYTTFSTFMLENLNLMRNDEIKGMLANILISNIFGVIMVISGFVLGRYCINLIRG
ncbi:MAG: fluoride efflux transporter CrcB [Candidatus Margulisiibacteriota bacterium]